MRSPDQLDKVRRIMITNYDLIKQLLPDRQVETWLDETFARASAEQKAGYSESDIARVLGFSVSNLRALHAIEGESQRKADAEKAIRYQDMGLTIAEIAKLMDKKQSSIRSLLGPGKKEIPEAKVISTVLKAHVDADRYIDVGKGTEVLLNCKVSVLAAALDILKNDGYKIYRISINRLHGEIPKEYLKVLTLPEVELSEVVAHKSEIKKVEM